MGRLEEHAVASLSGSVVKKTTKHVPLLKRATEPALEERLLKYHPAAGAHDGQSDEHHMCPSRANELGVHQVKCGLDL